MSGKNSLDFAIAEAKKIRRNLLRSTLPSWPTDLLEACGLASVLLSIALDDVRTLRFRPGHCWNRIGRTIIDITATQFNRDKQYKAVRGVLVTNRPRSYHEGRVLKGMNAYIAIIGWYDEADYYNWDKVSTYWPKRE
jgi:hypothetical protein